MDKSVRKKFINSYINSSKRRIRNMEEAFEENDFGYVIRVSQEVFELLTKALLIRWNFVVPKTHNLSEDLYDIKELCSKDFQKEINNIIIFSKELRRNREKSFYGDEEEGITPEEMYTKDNAKTYLENIKWFYELVIGEIKDFN
jgi:HEPN domain-containing protein